MKNAAGSGGYPLSSFFHPPMVKPIGLPAGGSPVVGKKNFKSIEKFEHFLRFCSINLPSVVKS